MSSIYKLIQNPAKIIYLLNKLPFRRFISDELFLKWKYKARFGRKLDLCNPKSYTEKLQWLKLYDRKSEYVAMVDKYEAKKYVADRIGGEYIIPTLGIWDDFDDINFDELPEQFVLKCTHDSGGLVICRNKAELDIAWARKKITKCLKRNFYWQGREWPYKNVKPRIIAEEYMVDESGYELKDYKIFCFGGTAKALYVASDRSKEDEETKFDFYDMEFNHLPFTNGHPNAQTEIKRPASFDKMRELAEELSKGIPHIRVDFYDINGRVYFGELTFFHHGGFTPFNPEEWDYKFGEWIKLPSERYKID